jgi:hypothetical protein
VVAIVRRELALVANGRHELDAIAEVLGEVSRALDSPEALVAANRRFAHRIRSGALDEGEQARAVRDLVRRQVERKLAVNNPAFLERVRKDEG